MLQLGSLSGRIISHRPDSEDSQQQGTVDQLELQFYETQLELYDTKFEILKNEEQLLVAQIDTLRRQIKGRLYMMSNAVVNSRCGSFFWFMEGGERETYHLLQNWITVKDSDVLLQSTLKQKAQGGLILWDCNWMIKVLTQIAIFTWI